MPFKIVDYRASAKQNIRGDNESPWKIPQYISIVFDLSVPLSCVSKRLVVHNDIFTFRKLIIMGEILYSLSAFIKQS